MLDIYNVIVKNEKVQSIGIVEMMETVAEQGENLISEKYGYQTSDCKIQYIRIAQ